MLLFHYYYLSISLFANIMICRYYYCPEIPAKKRRAGGGLPPQGVNPPPASFYMMKRSQTAMASIKSLGSAGFFLVVFGGPFRTCKLGPGLMRPPKPFGIRRLGRGCLVQKHPTPAGAEASNGCGSENATAPSDVCLDRRPVRARQVDPWTAYAGHAGAHLCL